MNGASGAIKRGKSDIVYWQTCISNRNSAKKPIPLRHRRSETQNKEQQNQYMSKIVKQKTYINKRTTAKTPIPIRHITSETQNSERQNHSCKRQRLRRTGAAGQRPGSG